MKFSWLSAVRGLSLPVLLLAVTGACSSDDGTTDIGTGPTTNAVLENYAANLHAAYAESVKDTEALKVALQTLVATPSAANLEAAKAAWLASRANYMLTEGARFYDGPIDAEPANHEGAVNSWPFDEAYIDYVVDGPTRSEEQGPGTGGIIADATIELTADNLDALNGEGGDENISAGWHAIEFLLRGQALEEVGPGQRTFNDYVLTDPVRGATAERRGQYLIAVVDGILGHLNALVKAWEPGATYRTEFVANANDESVINALSGLGKMSKGELAGERINAGLESKERRDQHNCFSSTTLVDYERDARGIRDMFLGNFGSNDGPGFDELVAAKDKDLAAKIEAQLNLSIDSIKGISVPFEAAIAGADSDPNRAKLIDVRESLRTQGDMFGQAATALGLSLTIPEEN